MSGIEEVVLLGLVLAAFFAGMVDAIAGGGGLITLPALLAAGLPPHLALGTNKGQSVFGAATSVIQFWRAGALDEKRIPWSFLGGATGSLVGAVAVLRISSETLRPIVLVLLIAIGFALAMRPDFGEKAAHARAEEKGFARVTARGLPIAIVMGFYDGFFGPGTGTFLIVAFTMFLRDSFKDATANAKVVNFATNLAAVAIFAHQGVIRWELALPMAIAQFLGATIGVRLAIRKGAPLIRKVMFFVVVALATKLATDFWR